MSSGAGAAIPNRSVARAAAVSATASGARLLTMSIARSKQALNHASARALRFWSPPGALQAKTS